MATGYTADLTADTTFKHFALRCARAFGATIMQRDDPMDAELEEPQPGDYNSKSLGKAQLELDKCNYMLEADADEYANNLYTEQLATREKALAEIAVKRANYERLIAETEAWVPPTAEHQGMKDFMLQQLRDSLKWDCSTSYYDKLPKKLTGKKWLQSQADSAEKDIAYHTEQLAKDVETANNRSQWIRDLKNSL